MYFLGKYLHDERIELLCIGHRLCKLDWIRLQDVSRIAEQSGVRRESLSRIQQIAEFRPELHRLRDKVALSIEHLATFECLAFQGGADIPVVVDFCAGLDDDVSRNHQASQTAVGTR